MLTSSIGVTNWSATRSLKDETFQCGATAAQFQPEASFTTNEFETMVAMVELDVGIAIVSEETANKLLSNSKRRLAAIRMDMDYKEAAPLAWRG